ncbi:SUMF1/EgtB/PvdO family nonheme iron enzyme [Conexibacter sp. DBS9H8]|uniref:SUMF1/EgtB/PvdO family nonheme iron enzyme n=1 Tax=Conexibacter sp. DBS9H8 TaxID=2937801 RepID=UPI00200F0D84|nr:SUMF1/EgtB/PvdO family nonheme iron enzyme [Conexibacter sp. DBS9H8]
MPAPSSRVDPRPASAVDSVPTVDSGSPQSDRAEDTVAALDATRTRTRELVWTLDAATLEAVHSTLLSPLVWDLGHIAAFEDLWISRTFGTEMLAPDLIRVYDADETPRAQRGTLPFLPTAEANGYLDRSRARTHELIAAEPLSDQTMRRLELILRHELQHHETMLQTMQIAGLEPGLAGVAAGPAPVLGSGAPDGSGAGGAGGGSGEAARPNESADSGDLTLALIPVPAAEHLIGADSGRGFAYDNEQPRHPCPLPGFQIAAGPVTNAAWQRFIADGGYRRRELWSDAGWAWREAEATEGPLYWTDAETVVRFGRHVPINPLAPVCHVSCFEADAFARFHGLRLPTEVEWEAAALWSAAASPGRLHGMGASVWQWTASEFAPYPGFRADPYPEYSEQFFDAGYRVLRGGAWVSAPRVATVHFRNWDLPQRRQIFSGLRLAGDA